MIPVEARQDRIAPCYARRYSVFEIPVYELRPDFFLHEMKTQN